MEGSSLGLRKGAWTAEEDVLLKRCIEKYGEGKWHQVPSRAGLNRCRKSCRLRWLNYVKPNIKRGHFAADEVDLIIRLHDLLGNRWSLIAGRLPGRTANDVKNYWNTHLKKNFNLHKKQMDPKPHENDSNPKVNVIKPQPRTLSKNSFPIMLHGNNKNYNVTAAAAANNNLALADNNYYNSSPSDNNDIMWWENLINNDDNELLGDQQQGSLQSSKGMDEELGERRSKVVESSWDELFSDVELWNVFFPEPENFV